MATIPSTRQDFEKDFAKFHEAIGFKTNTQEQIAGGYKCLALRYLGLAGASEEDLEHCAMLLQIATEGAIARGWHIGQR